MLGGCVFVVRWAVGQEPGDRVVRSTAGAGEGAATVVGGLVSREPG